MIRLRNLPIVLTATLGILASAGLLVLALSAERQVISLDFHNRAAEHLAVLNDDLHDADSLLETVRAYFEAADHPIGLAEFNRFARKLPNTTAGLFDLGWAPRVTDAERDGFERNLQQAGSDDFEIRASGADGLVRAGRRAAYYPILYINKVDPRDESVTGYDLTSEPLRRAAIERAIASNRPSATLPLKLLTVNGPRAGLMSFVPVTPTDISPNEGIVLGAYSVANVARQDHVATQGCCGHRYLRVRSERRHRRPDHVLATECRQSQAPAE